MDVSEATGNLVDGIARSGRTMYPITLRDDLRHLVTARMARLRPRYNWFVYPHSFAPELVGIILERFPIGRTSGSIIYDPFVGAGTTLLACKELGISGYGLDQLPLSLTLSTAKLGDYEQRSLVRIWRGLNRAMRLAPAWPIPNSDIPLVREAFHPAMLSRLMLLNREIERQAVDPIERAFFHTALLTILENCGRARKAGGWLRLGTDAPPGTVLLRYFNAQVKRMIADSAGDEVTGDGYWSVAVGDARTHVTPMKITGVISSPPYLNRHDYTRIFCLELALGFVSGQEELKDLRYGSLRSHVEARGNAHDRGYRMPDRLAALLPILIDRGVNDSRLMRMITGYFEDMHATLLSIKASLVHDGFVALVLGNSRFSGVTIPVDEIVAEIGEQIGLTWCATWVARHRGNSAQQMASYGRAPSRESVILWTNDG